MVSYLLPNWVSGLKSRITLSIQNSFELQKLCSSLQSTLSFSLHHQWWEHLSLKHCYRETWKKKKSEFSWVQNGLSFKSRPVTKFHFSGCQSVLQTSFPTRFSLTITEISVSVRVSSGECFWWGFLGLVFFFPFLDSLYVCSQDKFRVTWFNVNLKRSKGTSTEQHLNHKLTLHLNIKHLVVARKGPTTDKEPTKE